MDEYLQTVEIETGEEPEASVLWLHGLGADGHDFESIVPELDLPFPVRYVFPHAPVRNVTINNGMAMRAWYDIYSFERGGPVDEAGMRDSQQSVEALLKREQQRGISPQRTVLAGFSQGGAIALQAGLAYPRRLAGIMGLSCYLPLQKGFEKSCSQENLATPVLLAHGSMDPVLPQALGENARDFLIQQGYSVEWRSYLVAHGVCQAEIQDIGRWLSRVLEKR
ncbi:MAG: alpha/beta hydrolase fold domain-containing protein [Proteobacteria bacterium]|nr:alpha/beta hydrolase fold domain-containing protein [Pseudomonadota bacterium]